MLCKHPLVPRVAARDAGQSMVSGVVQRAALRKLLILDAADELGDLRVPPGNRLEELSGDRAGSYSIRINDQWRVCFEWFDGDAHGVEITDYH